MGAKIGKFLATLLLSVPLAAIGLMAIFGIPQLVPASANSASRGGLQGIRDALQWPPATTSDLQPEVNRLGDAPPFDAATPDTTPLTAHNARPSAEAPPPWNTPGHANTRSSSQSHAAPAAGSSALSQAPRHWSEIPPMTSSPPPSGRQELASASDSPWEASSLSASSAPQSPPASSLGWREASLRLAELRIENYHLERGSQHGSFLFVCHFSPGDAPHITHRFEAEAEDPLVAVNQVLHQVDRWMTSRFAATNFPARSRGNTLGAETAVQ